LTRLQDNLAKAGDIGVSFVMAGGAASDLKTKNFIVSRLQERSVA
jgi:hypothetical protein